MDGLTIATQAEVVDCQEEVAGFSGVVVNDEAPKSSYAPTERAREGKGIADL